MSKVFQELVAILKHASRGALCLVALAGALTSPVAAQEETPSVVFTIASQPLSSALHIFAETTDWQVSIPSEIVADMASPGVNGTHTPEEGLKALLVGTGLTYRVVSPKIVTLERESSTAFVPGMIAAGTAGAAGAMAATNGDATATGPAMAKPVQVPEVVVKDTRQRDNDTQSYVAEESSTATRTDTPFIQIPQSVGVVTQRVIQDQRAVRMDQALRNVSGIAIAQSNEGEANNDKMFCRGFPCAFFKNNLRNEDTNQVLTFRDISNVQRLEVLKGPPSVLYGRSEPGGIINILTKQPQAERYASIDQIIGSFNFYRTMVDVTGPMNESKTLLFRVNGAYENRESFRDFVEGQRYFIAPVFTWKASNKTTITIEGEYIHDRTTFDAGLPAVGEGIAQVPRSRFLGEPYNLSKTEEGRVSLLVAHRFTDSWRIESQFRADESNIQGNFAFSDGLLPDNQSLARTFFALSPDISSYYWRNDVIGKVATGSLKHELLGGVELGHQTASLKFGFAPLNNIDIFNPIYNQLPEPTAPDFLPNSRMFANAAGAYVQDQVALLNNLHLLVGARGDYFYQNSTVGTDVTKAENWGFSPRIGVSYQPIAPVSLYANVTRSFQPIFTPFSAISNVSKPTTATQYEAGVKTVLVPDRLTSTLAIYQINKRDAPVVDPANPFLILQTGAQRSQGVEFDIAAQLLAGWRAIATYAYTDARVTADTTIPVGNRLPLVARNTGSFWTTYDIQEGLFKGVGAGTGIFAVGQRAGDITNSFYLPGYVRWDAALYYRKQEILPHTNLVAQLNFLNLLNQEYFFGGQQSRGAAAFPGAPLSLLGSIKLEFF
ncbi:putative Ferric iron uptake protein [Nitrospira japonica]|uniref:Putative Ferric iron uptake protein n=1 Tax=Nitrospira japonica TaxID=1325564 RepID=A0A1W1I6E5_9BACT|nr:TonB-dependent receptor [Nitrospira japonica]SLM48598.1 putative Ferric iron uptake protein [Nitrospira japonica]